jgi:hypothetical protein
LKYIYDYEHVLLTRFCARQNRSAQAKSDNNSTESSREIKAFAFFIHQILREHIRFLNPALEENESSIEYNDLKGLK